jgi:hypothetical protein
MSRRNGCILLMEICTMILVGCSGNPNTSLPNGTPLMAIAANSGTPQSHTINGEFGSPLVAMVNSDGAPASGVTVTFTAPASAAGGTFADTGKNTTTATSNTDGLATSAVFTANGVVGTYVINASTSGASAPATFTLTNTTGAPATINAAAGNSQSTVVDTAFTNPLQVTVLDSGRNPVSNAVVSFAAPATGASCVFTNANNPGSSTAYVSVATTNASGIATSPALTANSIAGAVTITATVAGAAPPATFALTNLPGIPATVTPISGMPQSAIGDQAFSLPLSVKVVDNQNNLIAGVTVTFAAPTTGASGIFSSSSSNTTTATTNASGVATTSGTFTANATAGTYSVNATAAGGSGPPASFSLTNWPVGSQHYSFYLGGQEHIGVAGFYALAGSVVIDPTGGVLAGEQDYNDGNATSGGIASPQPSGDTITGGTLSLGATNEQGTLVLDTNNLNVGVGGVETLGIQFVNSNHALIAQFDGSATSSGSLDLETLPTNLSSGITNGSYAFTLTGLDPSIEAVGYGGVFTISGGTNLQNGLADINDSETGTTAVTGVSWSGTLSPPDTFGRGTITTTLAYAAAYSPTGTSIPIVLNYYVLGPETLRLIDVDTTDTAIGSAYGQGTNSSSASNSSLATSIFGLSGTSYSLSQYGTAGMFTPVSSAATFSGVADDNELSYGVNLPDTSISGTYSIATNGYGNFAISAGVLGDVSTLGLYMTDPKLNLLDPNNTSNGVGGALLLDLDMPLAGGTGLVIPQTDNSTVSFTGNYSFGGQAQAYLTNAGEFDFLANAEMTTGTLKATGLLSDPFLTLGETSATNSDVRYGSIPLADPNNAGRYTMLTTNAPTNPLKVSVKGIAAEKLNVVIYQASGNQLFWLDEDSSDVFFGTLQQQGTFTTVPFAKNVAP